MGTLNWYQDGRTDNLWLADGIGDHPDISVCNQVEGLPGWRLLVWNSESDGDDSNYDKEIASVEYSSEEFAMQVADKMFA